MRKLSISAFAVVLVLTPIGASAQPRQANLPDGVGKEKWTPRIGQCGK